VGRAGRVPRRYRGKDTFYWLDQCRFFDRPASALPSPDARFAGNPQLSGKNGGHTINLHQFARDGVILLGRLTDVQDGRLILAPDLDESLFKADQFEEQVVNMIDKHIVENGIEAEEQVLPVMKDGYQRTLRSELNLHLADIRTVIWATGYRFDYDLVRLPVCAPDGFPITQRGVTAYPGLYFLGMPWLTSQKSGLLLGVGEDAEFIAGRIDEERQSVLHVHSQ
jgi:putative flavoprotein involved in K+ transport